MDMWDDKLLSMWSLLKDMSIFEKKFSLEVEIR